MIMFTGLCIAREPEQSSDASAGWVVGVVIGSMVFVVMVIIIIVCCVCKKAASKGMVVLPKEHYDRDIHGLNKSVYHVGHYHHPHHHHHGHSSGVHYDHDGHPIGVSPGQHTQSQTQGNVPIPSISVSQPSPEVSMDPQQET